MLFLAGKDTGTKKAPFKWLFKEPLWKFVPDRGGGGVSRKV